jgi:short-subunit dehydrogenase
LDVCDKDSVTHAWEELTQTFTTIDTVIYCAGAYEVMSAENFKLDVAEQMINVNLTGALRVLKMVIPMLIQHQQGHIVLIGSIAGYRGLPNAIGYGASKAGLIHLAENLKCDLAQHNIKVQVINPGFVKTQLTDKNTFSMPFILSPEQAAKQIVTAMTNKSFESRFPFVFANGLKLLSKLPYWLYFYLIRKATGT